MITQFGDARHARDIDNVREALIRWWTVLSDAATPALTHMHAILQQYIFIKHVKDANTYMPDREEDERSTEDKGKHIAKGSESEHN